MAHNKKLLFILKGYPRLSETFILQEIVALEEQGFELHIMAIRHPHDDKTHELVNQVKAKVTYLPTHLWMSLGRLWKAIRRHTELVSASGSGNKFGMTKVMCKRIWTEKSLKPLKRAAQALVMLAERPAGFDHLHAHFIHAPADLAYYGHLISGLPYTISAHAKDIWTSRKQDLIPKLQKASWVTCCTKEGQTYLQGLTNTPVHLIYHGIDLTRFPLRSPSPSSKAEKFKLCLVGRLVPKKGIDVLFDALSTLPVSQPWELSIAGSGVLQDHLVQKAQQLNLDRHIRFLGSVTSVEVKTLLQSSDLFVLPCRVEDDGDRDGIPNVIMEAISQGLPILTTKVGGIQELLCKKSAILIDPDNPYQLQEALSTLMTRPELRYALAKEAQKKLQMNFRLEQGIARLAQEFEKTLSLRTPDA